MVNNNSENRISLLSGSTVVAMVFMVTTEIMFFTALISAYIVNRESSRLPWPPPDQPKLPEAITGINTLILLSSAILLTIALFRIKKEKNVALLLWTTIAFGLIFVLIQGFEWYKLLSYGYSIKNVGLFASFYYTMIGAHAFHAIMGIIASTIIVYQFTRKNVEKKVYNRIGAFSFYWYFVVGIWPFIYYVIYLY